jgi:hypothetical protein
MAGVARREAGPGQGDRRARLPAERGGDRGAAGGGSGGGAEARRGRGRGDGEFVLTGLNDGGGLIRRPSRATVFLFCFRVSVSMVGWCVVRQAGQGSRLDWKKGLLPCHRPVSICGLLPSLTCGAGADGPTCL